MSKHKQDELKKIAKKVKREKALNNHLKEKVEVEEAYLNEFNEFQAKSHEVFNTTKKSKKEHRLVEENKELKRIIADLTVELKKSEYELEGEGL